MTDDENVQSVSGIYHCNANECDAFWTPEVHDSTDCPRCGSHGAEAKWTLPMSELREREDELLVPHQGLPELVCRGCGESFIYHDWKAHEAECWTEPAMSGQTDLGAWSA